MKIIKVISKSKNETRMEVIAEDGGDLYMLHVHRQPKGWAYYADSKLVKRDGVIKREPGFELMKEE